MDGFMNPQKRGRSEAGNDKQQWNFVECEIREKPIAAIK
jgi:hypothetical protein